MKHELSPPGRSFVYTVERTVILQSRGDTISLPYLPIIGCMDFHEGGEKTKYGEDARSGETQEQRMRIQSPREVLHHHRVRWSPLFT